MPLAVLFTVATLSSIIYPSLTETRYYKKQITFSAVILVIFVISNFAPVLFLVVLGGAVSGMFLPQLINSINLYLVNLVYKCSYRLQCYDEEILIVFHRSFHLFLNISFILGNMIIGLIFYNLPSDNNSIRNEAQYITASPSKHCGIQFCSLQEVYRTAQANNSLPEYSPVPSSTKYIIFTVSMFLLLISAFISFLLRDIPLYTYQRQDQIKGRRKLWFQQLSHHLRDLRLLLLLSLPVATGMGNGVFSGMFPRVSLIIVKSLGMRKLIL